MKRRTVVGIIFIVAALLRLAEIWGIVNLDWLWNKSLAVYFAPAILLYVGVELVIYSFRQNRDQWLRRAIPQDDEGKRIVCSARYGGDEYVFNGEPFHGAELNAFCGGIRLDLRQAVITEDEAIDIRTYLGGVILLVPSTINVVVKSHSFVGGVGNNTSKSLGENAHCLHVTASNMFGGVSIRNAD